MSHDPQVGVYIDGVRARPEVVVVGGPEPKNGTYIFDPTTHAEYLNLADRVTQHLPHTAPAHQRTECHGECLRPGYYARVPLTQYEVETTVLDVPGGWLPQVRLHHPYCSRWLALAGFYSFPKGL